MKEPDTLGERIRFLLERKGLTQKDLALYLREQHNQRATNKSVSRWINDDVIPKKETIGYIAEFLNTTAAYLQGEISLPWSLYDEDESGKINDFIDFTFSKHKKERKNRNEIRL